MPGFNGASVFQPRKETHQPRLTTPKIRFNGASVFQPRKVADRYLICLAIQIASMGPRSFNRGKVIFSQVSSPATPSLQWGLGLSTEESTAWLLPYRCGGNVASMGPRSFNRGKFPLVFHAGHRSPSFNGASVFQPRKVLPTLYILTVSSRFNGASVFQPRKGDHPLLSLP